MDPVLAAIWEVFFPALLCLGEAGPIKIEGTTKIQPPMQWIFEMKTILPANSNEESSYKPCTNSQEYAILFTTTVTAPDKASDRTIVTIGACSTITLKIILGEAPSTSGLEGSVSGDASTTSPGVVSTGYEAVTKSAVQNITGTVSTKIPSPMSSAVVSPVGVTTQNRFSTAEPERDPSFLQQLSSDTEDAGLTRKPQDVTFLSAADMTGSTRGNIYPSVDEETSTHALVTDLQNATSPTKESAGDTQGNSATCYPDCGAFPAWATTLLCMATAFIVFMLVCLFLIPYCMKLRKPTVIPYSISPRYSA
ncbi:hypothetical protein JRQ81_003428 [Phrynocephalus forsythii]|uniref:Uncharacterized protein n=1 Tax=Phrynocephalus forsythii TaxID=171643 RepID=A0A9Q1AX71_9SAUR|nr:hypothetical protein JRQ81_003428 [Phrynocephalus forsythii]